MTGNAERDALITRHYIAGKKLTDIARLFGMKCPGNIRVIAKRNGASPRTNGRPRHETD